MGLDSWATQRTALCANAACEPFPVTSLDRTNGHIRACALRRRAEAPNTLAGYCRLIWADCVMVNGAIVGTAVADGEMFRFFAADVRLDDLDGLTWPTMEELRSETLVARSLILASFRSNGL